MKNALPKLLSLVAWVALSLGCSKQEPPAAAELPSPSSGEPTQAELTAADILQNVRDHYAQMAAYRNHGGHTETTTLADGTSTERQWGFDTWYRRDDQFFRMDFTSDQTYQVLRNGHGVLCGYDLEERDSLMSALHVANGITNGTALMIPCLLAPQEINRSAFWGAIRELQRVEDETVDGRRCFHLAGEYRGNGSVDFWINEAFLIEKIRTEEPLTNTYVRTWTFDPEVDKPIADHVFVAETEVPVE